jgi:CPA1 family monovalent cation:H+ antiporter
MVLVAPFLLYAVAERFEGSGILAVVVAGLLIAHVQNADPGHTGRVQSTVVWKHITFVLQALAFFLVGLELPEVISRLDSTERGYVLVLVPAAVIALVLTRFTFVFVMVAIRGRHLDAGRAGHMRSATIVSWAGARGPVSGLAAFSIPVAFSSGELVPYRDVILATTFCVIVITLLLSLTLAPLARAVGVPRDDDDATLRRVDALLARAAIDRLGDLEAEAVDRGEPLDPDVIDRLRQDVERRIRVDTGASDPGTTQELRAQEALTAARAMVRAEQEELIRLRDEEGLPDAIARPILRDLDLRDQALAARGR